MLLNRKIMLGFIKVFPILLLLIHTYNISLALYLHSILFLGSIFPIVAILTLLLSFVFKFCIWHRLPLYVVLLRFLLNTIIDFYVLPITVLYIAYKSLIITSIIAFTSAIIKEMYNKMIMKYEFEQCNKICPIAYSWADR